MESKKAKKYLEHQYDAYKNNKATGAIVADDYNQFARQAVEIAESELKEKAVEAHRKTCIYINMEGDCNQTGCPYKCNYGCDYMMQFKELINK